MDNIPDIQFDLGSEVPVQINYDPIPSGYYVVEIKKAEYRTSRKSETPSICIHCSVLDPLGYGTTLFEDLWLTKMGQVPNKKGDMVDSYNLKRIKLLLRVLDKKHTDVQVDISKLIKDFDGGRFVAKVGHEIDEYGEKNPIKGMRRLDDRPHQMGPDGRPPQVKTDTPVGAPVGATPDLTLDAETPLNEDDPL